MYTPVRAQLRTGHRSRAALAMIILLPLLLLGCDGGSTPGTSGPVSVFVSIPPQVFFAERIGGEQIKVESLVTAGSNPHTFAPTPAQMTRLASAELFLAIGVEFETALLEKMRSAYPNLTIVETQTGIITRDFGTGHEDHAHASKGAAPRKQNHGHAHKHGDGDQHNHDHAHESSDDHAHAHPESAPAEHEHPHHHTGGDPHVWLDPQRAKRLARNVCAALAAKAPQHEQRFLQNLEQLEADLDALHAELTVSLEPYAGRSVFVYHPAYGYLTELYQLKQVPVEIDGRSPTASDLAGLVEDVRDANAKVIYYEPQFDKRNVQRLADELGTRIEVLDPLAPDYLENMRRMAAAIVAGWSKPS